MWFLTSIYVDDRSSVEHRRVFGFLTDLSEAIKAIETNRGDMHECFYQFLILENIRQGVHPESISEVWYEWYQFPNGSQWQRIEKPSVFDGVVNWALG